MKTPIRIVLACSTSLMLCCVAFSADKAPEIVSRDVVTLAADGTSVDRMSFDQTVERSQDIDDAGKFAYTFDPDHETFKVLEAWVEQPDGKHIDVPLDSVIVRPSAASRDAPGFVSTKTATLLFKQVQLGSKIHVKAVSKIFKPYDVGFTFTDTAELLHPNDTYVSLRAPASMPLTIGHRNGFEVTAAS